jgi:type IV fimbrial biogenesis protein FimT
VRNGATSLGFTLIELMITLVILAIVITVGVPSFNDFIASQRVRTAASDVMADMAFARAEAIKESRRTVMESLGGAGTWKNGWRICVDMNNDGDCDTADPVRKTTTPVAGRAKVCASPDEAIVFRPDGRVIRATAPTANDGIRVSDDLGDTNASNDRVRLVILGVSGRPSVVVQDGGAACP